MHEARARERDALAALDREHRAACSDAGVAGERAPVHRAQLVRRPADRSRGEPAAVTHDRLRSSCRCSRRSSTHARIGAPRPACRTTSSSIIPGGAKLLDFSIAKPLALPEGEAPFTEAGALMTLRYTAPGRCAGPAGDGCHIYSAGVVLGTAYRPHAVWRAGNQPSLQLMQAVTEVEPRACRAVDRHRYRSQRRWRDPAQPLRLRSSAFAEEHPPPASTTGRSEAQRVPPWRRAWRLAR